MEDGPGLLSTSLASVMRSMTAGASFPSGEKIALYSTNRTFSRSSCNAPLKLLDSIVSGASFWTGGVLIGVYANAASYIQCFRHK